MPSPTCLHQAGLFNALDPRSFQTVLMRLVDLPAAGRPKSHRTSGHACLLQAGKRAVIMFWL